MIAQNFNWIDYAFIAIFAFSMLAGLGRGLVKEVISLLTLIVAFLIATIFANPIALKFTSSGTVQSAVNSASSTMGVSAESTVSYAAIGLSFALLFAGTVIIGSIVGSIINLAFQYGILGLGNRLLGAIFGCIRGFIINLVIIFVIQLTGFSSSPTWQKSQLVIAYQPAVVWLGGIVSPSLAHMKEKLQQKVQDVSTSVQQMAQ